MSLRRFQLLGAAVCVPLALGACSLTRPPSAAPAPIPAQWNAPLPPPGGSAALPHAGSPAALADWWRQLDDPLLVELIEAAEAASPTLASAAARIGDARATSVAAGAALLPNLTGTLSATRSNSQSGSSGTGTSSSTSSSSTSSASIPPMTTLQAGLQSSWEVDLFGKLRSGRDAASLRLAGADAKWHQARVSVAADTANLYFSERACERQLAVAENDTRSRAETARLNDLSMRAGFTAPADAALARASAADAAGRLTQQRATCAVSRAGLVALTGIEARALEQKLAAAPVDRALPAVQSVASVPAEALAQRPDVYSAELDVAAASADVGEAEAQRYPRLSLTGSIGRLQIRTQGTRQTLDTWSAGPVSLTVPILDGGAYKANAEAARGRYDEMASIYRGSVRQAVREVEEALLNLDSTASRTGDADTAVQNYQASFNATQARYDSGLASLFELEDSRRTLLTAQTARVALQRERAEAWVALYRAMGGGWARPDAAAPLAMTRQETTTTKSP
ncbi:efflux transporter outer membrane subunit [Variovorax sp. J22G21]|uniref:efflux transporter outer membrane subunit n=1 Tax=Variovorax fucosicus TaxID=3053517 RepID=UPI0025755178|nr:MULTISPECIES: efflux transporter outer membrane subunit [unclassified Variovorax]MDM0042082.1 efflux transporter outer membrane subunit [Variovorax sp. J22R193]MDM0059852.1 efflux transporter outer membrane subunit [Variovorax sp. J22G21]